MNQPCTLCGYDDQGTGSAHVCSKEMPKCQVDPTKASRFNTGKSRWSLVSFEALEPMVEVLEFGAEKYAPGNWANGGGLSHSETMESLARHLFALMRGEDIDPESGKPHIGHIQCNAMFLGHFYKYPEEFNRDDRVLLGSRNTRKVAEVPKTTITTTKYKISVPVPINEAISKNTLLEQIGNELTKIRVLNEEEAKLRGHVIDNFCPTELM